MPITINPADVLERLKTMLAASPDDVRLMRAVEWVSGEIADSRREQRAA